MAAQTQMNLTARTKAAAGVEGVALAASYERAGADRLDGRKKLLAIRPYAFAASGDLR